MKSFNLERAILLIILSIREISCDFFKLMLVKDADFAVASTLPYIKTLRGCQTQAKIAGLNAYVVNNGECQLGTVAAVLPSIADEPDQITVWTLQDSLPSKGKIQHVMAFIAGNPSQLVDYSFDEGVSRSLGTLESWSLEDTTFWAFWNYKGGVLYCGHVECFFKSRDTKAPVLFNQFTTERRGGRGFSHLNGQPWIVGGKNATNAYLYTSEVLDPVDDTWKEGPAVPEEGGIVDNTCCLEDLGNGKMLFFGFGEKHSYTFDAAAKKWTRHELYLSGVGVLKVRGGVCAKMAHPGTGEKLLIMAGGKVNNHMPNNNTFIYNIDMDVWTEGPPSPMDFRLYGTAVGPDQGLDALYVIGGRLSWNNGSVLRLREDLSAWDLVQDWDLRVQALQPVPLLYN